MIQKSNSVICTFHWRPESGK